MRYRANRPILTSTAPFAFTASCGETTPDHYWCTRAQSHCELPRPNWLFDARKVEVDVGGNAKIYRSTFDLHGIHSLVPYVTHPVEKESRSPAS